MPTYQYACKECGHRFETLQAFSDASLTECPTCGGQLRKVFNSVGVVFKGSGFYRNDSRNETASKVPAGKDGGDGGKESGGNKESGNGKDSSSESGTKKDSAGDKKSSSDTKAAGDSSSSKKRDTSSTPSSTPKAS